MRKNCSSDREKLLTLEAECREFEITRTIYSNSERSEQFSIAECFFNLFLEVSHVQQIRTLKIQIGKKYWDLKTCKKS